MGRHAVSTLSGGGAQMDNPVSVLRPPAETPRLFAGRYRVTGTLGHGGMADVYAATDEVLCRPVAVKVFRPGPDSESDRDRFHAEVRTLAGLTHPNLVALYDVGHDVTRPWCVMQFLDGGTLADLHQAQPSDRVVELGAQLADGLAYIHELGIVHRDVKPSNVLLDGDGTAYLSDFGVARRLDDSRLTSPGAMLGTAAFLAPEQVLGTTVGPEADVYALGLVLLEALTNRREYPGAAVESALARLNRPPQVPAGLPAGWAELIGAMTSLDPADRPTAETVARRLRAGLGSDLRSSPVWFAAAGSPRPGRAGELDQDGDPDLAGNQDPAANPDLAGNRDLATGPRQVGNPTVVRRLTLSLLAAAAGLFVLSVVVRSPIMQSVDPGSGPVTPGTAIESVLPVQVASGGVAQAQVLPPQASIASSPVDVSGVNAGRAGPVAGPHPVGPVIARTSTPRPASPTGQPSPSPSHSPTAPSPSPSGTGSSSPASSPASPTASPSPSLEPSPSPSVKPSPSPSPRSPSPSGPSPAPSSASSSPLTGGLPPATTV